MNPRNFQRIATNGIRLRTVVEGKGPLVILLHGFPQCREDRSRATITNPSLPFCLQRNCRDLALVGLIDNA
jgi:pimeloyl-ACP methyl ester carboxylesterase